MNATLRETALTLVVIEDDRIETEAVRRGVRRLGYRWRVVEYDNGAEALTALRGDDPAAAIEGPLAILLDLNIPGMNGIEVLREVRADPVLARTQVFVLTTSAHPDDVATTREIGIDGYFVKSRAGDDYVLALQEVQHAVPQEPES